MLPLVPPVASLLLWFAFALPLSPPVAAAAASPLSPELVPEWELLCPQHALLTDALSPVFPDVASDVPLPPVPLELPTPVEDDADPPLPVLPLATDPLVVLDPLVALFVVVLFVVTEPESPEFPEFPDVATDAVVAAPPAPVEPVSPVEPDVAVTVNVQVPNTVTQPLDV